MMEYPGMTAHIIELGSVTKEKLAPLLDRHITSPKKTAVGAEKEMKLWVFYSSLKNFSLMSLFTALKRYSINPNYQIFRVIYIHQ